MIQDIYKLGPEKYPSGCRNLFTVKSLNQPRQVLGEDVQMLQGHEAAVENQNQMPTVKLRLFLVSSDDLGLDDLRDVVDEPLEDDVGPAEQRHSEAVKLTEISELVLKRLNF